MPSRAADSNGKSRLKVRCAIYTRKSSEEGLEQDFNSLDAQREACDAFILSPARVETADWRTKASLATRCDNARLQSPGDSEGNYPSLKP
jgi:hypothetical protein